MVAIQSITQKGHRGDTSYTHLSRQPFRVIYLELLTMSHYPYKHILVVNMMKLQHEEVGELSIVSGGCCVLYSLPQICQSGSLVRFSDVPDMETTLIILYI